jgi:hypothetical protein
VLFVLMNLDLLDGARCAECRAKRDQDVRGDGYRHRVAYRDEGHGQTHPVEDREIVMDENDSHPSARVRVVVEMVLILAPEQARVLKNS